jgi:hypothetical protein
MGDDQIAANAALRRYSQPVIAITRPASAQGNAATKPSPGTFHRILSSVRIQCLKCGMTSADTRRYCSSMMDCGVPMGVDRLMCSSPG